MSAKTSGADTGGSRSYTPEQQAAVVRIRKCSTMAFYDILGIETTRATATETDIKRAYRKQSLLTHPDKNGHPHADEAFKMVSGAFGVLGDKDKKEKFDKYGVDPDNRFASQQAANADAWEKARQFRGQGGAGTGAMREEELTPEEMFQRFFAGAAGFGGGFGGFDMSNGFVFNMGGGPGVRVHQFGGARPRARPREATAGDGGGGGGQQHNLITTIITLLPVIIFFLVPLLSSLLSPSTSLPQVPRMVFDNPSVPFTEARTTEQFGIRYFVDPKDVVGMDSGTLSKLDRQAEQTLLRHLDRECSGERLVHEQMKQDAQGFFTVNQAKLAKANAFPKPNCDRLKKLGVLR